MARHTSPAAARPVPALLDRQTAQRLAFSIALAGYMLAFFHRQVPATLGSELQHAFADGTEPGVLATAYFYAYPLMQIPIGIILERGAQAGGVRTYSAGAYQVGFFGMAAFILAGWIGAWLILETRCHHLID